MRSVYSKRGYPLHETTYLHKKLTISYYNRQKIVNSILFIIVNIQIIYAWNISIFVKSKFLTVWRSWRCFSKTMENYLSIYSDLLQLITIYYNYLQSNLLYCVFNNKKFNFKGLWTLDSVKLKLMIHEKYNLISEQISRMIVKTVKPSIHYLC